MESPDPTTEAALNDSGGEVIDDTRSFGGLTVPQGISPSGFVPAFLVADVLPPRRCGTTG